NTFGNAYWAFRFIFQCIFYLLVLTLSLLQVYYPKPANFFGISVAIIAFSAIFLWLEFQQFLRNPGGYFTSPYNYVDVLVYVLPMATGIVDIIQEQLGIEEKTTRVMSFAVLAIYIHFLFELRVIKSVCSTVTIILKVVVKIKVFFFIFAASIFAFAHAFLHLLWAHSPDNVDKFEGAADYPKNIFGALSATYFFM
ncbi:hypothetical protein BGZ94_006250, partial [Podila epigama]